jgi:toxin ParE1/3/4
MRAEPRLYRLSPMAKKDLAGIWRYTQERWSLEQADRYYRDLISALEDLAGDKRKGKSMDGIRRGYLGLASGSHFIIYRERQVVVIRILHQRMNLKRHL